MQRFWFLFFFLLSACVQAQIHATIYRGGSMMRQQSFQDTLQLSRAVDAQLQSWISAGFYFAGIDSISRRRDLYQVFLHQGERYSLSIPEVRGNNLKREISRRIKKYGNGGFPFASIRVDSMTIAGSQLAGRLAVVPGPEIRYDSVFLLSPVKTRLAYIQQLIDMVPGDRFRENNYRQIAKKISRAPFLELRQPADLSFKDQKARVFLDIEENSSGSFQGVLGLQQVPGGRTSAVGSIDLNLQNMFRTGKELNIFWERFAQESQHLFLRYKHPFIFSSKISPAFSFDLIKQDTSFTTRTTGVGLYTYISPKTELLLEYSGVKGSLLTRDLTLISEEGFADFTRKTYKIQVQSGQLRSLARRRNDLVWKGSILGGAKQVDRNLNLPDQFYDTIQFSSDFYQWELMLAYQRKVFKRQTFFHEVESGWVENSELLNNERYRLGGLHSIRGFNEKEIFASRYLLSRIEFRSFFEEESYFFLFYDQLMYQRDDLRDNPFGIGLGFALQTSSGQFNFALGTGKSKNQNLSFSALKAHFGYLSRF